MGTGNRRQHGLSLPLDPHQVGSYIVFSFLAIGVYVFYVPFVPTPARYALVAVYTVLVACVFGLAFVASIADPSDPGLYTQMEGEFYCSICQATVGRSSKHCKTCNRCVSGFDHHCRWLNNCVGERNYRSFFCLVSLTVTMVTLQLGWGIWLVARSFYDDEVMMLVVADKYSYLNYRGWQATLLIYVLLLTAAVLMLGELLSFHTVLIYKNMTTFDYIVAQRQQAAGLQPSSPSDSGARAALCGRSNRVMDESAVHTPVQSRSKVSLNPCKACLTEKPEGNPQLWEAKARADKADVAATTRSATQADSSTDKDESTDKDVLRSSPDKLAALEAPSQNHGSSMEDRGSAQDLGPQSPIAVANKARSAELDFDGLQGERGPGSEAVAEGRCSPPPCSSSPATAAADQPSVRVTAHLLLSPGKTQETPTHLDSPTSIQASGLSSRGSVGEDLGSIGGTQGIGMPEQRQRARLNMDA